MDNKNKRLLMVERCLCLNSVITANYTQGTVLVCAWYQYVNSPVLVVLTIITLYGRVCPSVSLKIIVSGDVGIKESAEYFQCIENGEKMSSRCFFMLIIKSATNHAFLTTPTSHINLNCTSTDQTFMQMNS